MTNNEKRFLLRFAAALGFTYTLGVFLGLLYVYGIEALTF